MHRIGIIPFDIRGDATAIMFVTSQTRGRWILPKGKRDEGEDHKGTALREAMEEGGVQGVFIEDYPLTTIVTKQGTEGMQEVPVTYYPLLVTEQFDDWPEKEKRQRHWALVQDAHRVAYREDLLNVVNQFQSLLPWIKKEAERYK